MAKVEFTESKSKPNLNYKSGDLFLLTYPNGQEYPHILLNIRTVEDPIWSLVDFTGTPHNEDTSYISEAIKTRSKEKIEYFHGKITLTQE